jgi:hypothetical protein
LVLQELQEIKAGKIAERAITDLAVLGLQLPSSPIVTIVKIWKLVHAIKAQHQHGGSTLLSLAP